MKDDILARSVDISMKIILVEILYKKGEINKPTHDMSIRLFAEKMKEVA